MTRIGDDILLLVSYIAIAVLYAEHWGPRVYVGFGLLFLMAWALNAWERRVRRKIIAADARRTMESLSSMMRKGK